MNHRFMPALLMIALIGGGTLHAALGWTVAGFHWKRVVAVAVSPHGDILAASDSLIHRSTDDGRSWSSVSVGGAVRDLVMAPNGIGLASYTTSDGATDGLARSTDGGASWVRSTVEEHINALAVDRNGALIMIRHHDLLRSTDGASWTPLGTDGFGSSFNDLRLLAVGPHNEMLVANQGTSAGRVYATADGASWKQVYNGHEALSFVGFSGAGTMFLAVRDRVSISRDKGASWAQAQGVGTGTITWINRDNAVMVVRGNEIFLLTSALYRSTDDGATWRKAGSLPPLFENEYVTSMTLAPNGDLLAAASDGLYRYKSASSVDRGDDADAAPGLSIHPNPAREKVTIDLPAGAGEGCAVHLLDLLGREVATVEGIEPGTRSVACSTGGLAAGVYLIRVEAEGRATTAWLTVTR